MSLRRRIAGAAALAVAAVAATMGVVGYVTTRSHLVGEIRSELHERVRPYLQPHRDDFISPSGTAGEHGANPRETDGGGPAGETRAMPPFLAAVAESLGLRSLPQPPAPKLGGAPGYFQFVRADGHAFAIGGGAPQLPVGARTRAIARTGRGSFYTSATVKGVHLEVLTVGDAYDHSAVQVALPLTGVDSVLSGLLITYGLLIGGGIALAGLLGAVISRSALRPIERFVSSTERVSSGLDSSRAGRVRLEEQGASELRRLALSFNQTLDALERAVEAQRQLVADASHELRTPIAALRSDIQILLEADRLPATEREALQLSIIAELDELTQLVADVLELARGTSTGSQLEPVELDLIVREAVDRARRRAPHLRWRVDLAPTVIVNAPDRVGRAVGNVIDNARKWSPDGGEIEVMLRDGMLTVRDHGPGFLERDLPHVFDRFYRADSARGKPGAGLGLAIVKQAAEVYGGAASAANAPGGGAVLTIRFGSAPAAEAAVPQPGGPTAPNRSRAREASAAPGASSG